MQTKFRVAMMTGIAFILGLSGQLAAETLVRLDSLRINELRIAGIEVKQQAKVDIEAVGIMNEFSNDDLASYAWLLDSKTREVVWDMRESYAMRVRGAKRMLKANETVTLSPGKYELYYYDGGGNMLKINGNMVFDNNDGDRSVVVITDDDGTVHVYDPDDEDFDDEDYERLKRDHAKRKDADIEWDDDDYDVKEYDDKGWLQSLVNLFGGDSRDHKRKLRDCYVELTSSSLKKSDVGRFTVTGDLPGALIRHVKLGNEESIRDGFELTKGMSLRIYAIVEYPKGYSTAVDQVWIKNEETGEKVWEIDNFNTRWAGGGDKNRAYDDEISLPAGKYVLQVYTDDSHSYENFNVAPPYDPLNWGVTIMPGKNFDAGSFKQFTPGDRGKALIEMTRVRNNEYEEKLFKLNHKTNLRIFALGEFDQGDRVFADRGWIEDLASRKVVWEMDRYNTEYAGGAHKNRMFDAQITLEPGEYRAAYSTDGSHAYRDWNSSAPYEPRAWGMTIYPGTGYKDGELVPISESDVDAAHNVLVSIVRVRDDEDRYKSFSLDKPSRVRVYAIGEGVDGDMADYGFIIDQKTGRTVWEMTWRNTTYAGGAKKNRMFDDDLSLDAGKYEVHFTTDGSHAFNSWNDSQPRDPYSWGITVSLAK